MNRKTWGITIRNDAERLESGLITEIADYLRREWLHLDGLLTQCYEQLPATDRAMLRGRIYELRAKEERLRDGTWRARKEGEK